MFKMLFLEHIQMGELFLEHIQMGELVVVGLPLYQKPVGLYMAFPITDIVSFKRMVSVLNRQRNIIRQFQNNVIEFFFRQMSASRQFYIFLVLAGEDDFALHFMASRYSSNVLHTVPLPSSSSCMAFLVVSLGTSSILVDCYRVRCHIDLLCLLFSANIVFYAVNANSIPTFNFYPLSPFTRNPPVVAGGWYL